MRNFRIAGENSHFLMLTLTLLNTVPKIILYLGIKTEPVTTEADAAAYLA